MKNFILEPSYRQAVLIHLVMQNPFAATICRPFIANGNRLASIAAGGSSDFRECCTTLRFDARTVWDYRHSTFAYCSEDGNDLGSAINFLSRAFSVVPRRRRPRCGSGCPSIRMRKLSATDDLWLFALQLVSGTRSTESVSDRTLPSMSCLFPAPAHNPAGPSTKSHNPKGRHPRRP